MFRVLLVEDDLRLAAALTEVLSGRLHHTVTHVSTGAEALQTGPVDLVILDLGLPDMTGLEVLRKLRERHDMSAAGIIVLTARGQIEDRVAGLRAGADDYITKPVSVVELTARMEAVARRSLPNQHAITSAAGIEIDSRSRQASADGTPLDLTSKEYELLAVLVAWAGRTVPRQDLLLQVWGNTWPSNERSLEVHISGLRAKLGDAASVVTVRGVGYRLAES